MNSTLGFIARLILLSAAMIVLSACTGQQLEVTPISISENPQQHINQLDKDIAMARKNQVNVLAPTWFTKADKSLNAAKTGLEEGDQLAEIFGDIATGRAQLLKAEEFANMARSTIPDAIKARELARQAGATTLGDDYTVVENRFLYMTEAIERGNLGYAKRRQAAVTEQFRRIELRAIKIRTLGEVRRLIEDARKKGLHKMAPQSYADAQKKLIEADNFITENPYQNCLLYTSPSPRD